MPDTTCHMSISLDGFVAGPDQSRENPLGRRGRELHGSAAACVAAGGTGSVRSQTAIYVGRPPAVERVVSAAEQVDEGHD